MESYGRSRKVKECHGWSFLNTGLTFQVRKVICGVVVVVVGCVFCRINLNLGFGTWIWDLDLGLTITRHDLYLNLHKPEIQLFWQMKVEQETL